MHSLSTFKRLNDEAVKLHEDSKNKRRESQTLSSVEPTEVQPVKQERGVEQPAD